MASRGILAAAFAAWAAVAFAADVTVETVFGDDITGETRVVTGVSVTETDPTVPAWAKAAEPPATGDFTTNNVTLVGTVGTTITNVVTKPFVEGLGISGGEPEDYGEVRRAAFGAVQADNGSATNLQAHGIFKIWATDGDYPLVIHPYYNGEYFWFENGKTGAEARRARVEFPTDLADSYLAFRHDISAATSGLASEAYVDTAIDRLAAYYITANAKGDTFPTLHSLTNAAAYWSGGVLRTPTRNDYAVVLSDESHGNAEWRYIYAVAADGVTGQWEAQYPIETNDYDALSNRPQINGVTLGGTNNTAQGLGLLGTSGGSMNGTILGLVAPMKFGNDAMFAKFFLAAATPEHFMCFGYRDHKYGLFVKNGVGDAERFYALQASGGDIAMIHDITVKSVKRNGTALTPDANGAVDVAVPTIAGQTFDFSTNAGLYLAVSNLITALGGSVTNFPAIPQGGN